MMTERERILAVYNGETPDRVPFMLDLSHYYYHRFRKDWDLCYGYAEPERDLIDFNRKMGAGFYIANQAVFFRTTYDDDVRSVTTRELEDGAPVITWRYETPVGSIERKRVWMPGSYSWAIKKWGVKDEKDLEVLKYAMSRRHFTALPENYRAWADYTGDDGVVYLSPGYSAMGYLLHYWMGVEETMYGTVDFEEEMEDCINAINEKNLELVEMLASEYDAPVLVLGDNFSSEVQPPSFFAHWSRDFYERACRIAHSYGKKVAVHIDGCLKSAITMIREAGADAIDAVTPGSVGRMTLAECRAEADLGPTALGQNLILSGGIPNELWYSFSAMEKFEEAVKNWLSLKEKTSALISAAGDQVPPGAEETRILRMKELIEEYGRY